MSVLGVKDNPGKDDLRLRFEGDVEMRKDEVQIQSAVDSIVEMGARLDLDSIPILSYTLESRAWVQNYEGNLVSTNDSP